MAEPRWTLLNVISRLKDRWDELNFNDKYAQYPYIKCPRLEPLLNSREYLFIFEQNGQQANLTRLEDPVVREKIFEAMCELFGIDDVKSKEIIRGRFRWYRSYIEHNLITDEELFLDEPADIPAKNVKNWDTTNVLPVPDISTDEDDSSEEEYSLEEED